MPAEFLPDAALEDLGIVQVVYEIAASCNRGIVSENSEMQDLKNDRHLPNSLPRSIDRCSLLLAD